LPLPARTALDRTIHDDVDDAMDLAGVLEGELRAA